MTFPRIYRKIGKPSKHANDMKFTIMALAFNDSFDRPLNE